MTNTTPTEKYPYEAIIVLGAGMNPDGSLPLIPRRRVERAVELFHQNQARTIVMSGRWSMLAASPPPSTEAAAMRQYALTLDSTVATSILTEDESLDTLGNAYFVYKNFVRTRSWKRVLVVTSEFQITRCKYIFTKVLGDTCEVDFSQADSQFTPAELSSKLASEQKILDLLKSLLDPLANGDLDGIRSVMNLFPGYSEHPRYSRAVLLEMAQLTTYDNHEPA